MTRRNHNLFMAAASFLMMFPCWVLVIVGGREAFTGCLGALGCAGCCLRRLHRALSA